MVNHTGLVDQSLLSKYITELFKLLYWAWAKQDTFMQLQSAISDSLF